MSWLNYFSLRKWTQFPKPFLGDEPKGSGTIIDDKYEFQNGDQFEFQDGSDFEFN